MKRKRILLINPWIYDFAAVNMWARPLGLLRVAEFLSQFDVELRLIDCLDTFRPRKYNIGKYPKEILPTPQPLLGIKRRYGRYGIGIDDFINRLREAQPVDLVLVTSLMTYWYPGVFEVIRLCKKHLSNIPIILGGIYASLCSDHASTFSGADYIYKGRLDDGLHDVLEKMDIRLKLKGPLKPYYKLGFYKNLHYAPLLTSEGCPYKCSYCASGLLYNLYKRRSVDETIKEIYELLALGVSDFAFYDDALLYKPEEHIKPLLREIINRNIQARFHTPNGLHARYLDRDVAYLMYNSGFKTIRLSLETVNTHRQTISGGKVKKEDIEQAINNLKEVGFTKDDIGVYLMYGLPGQDFEEVIEGIQYLMSKEVKIYLSEYSPIPGTKDWQKLIDSGIINDDIDPLLTNNSVFSVLYSGYDVEEIKRIKEKVNLYNSGTPSCRPILV